MQKNYFFKHAIGILITLLPAVLVSRSAIDDMFFYFYSEKTSAKLINYGYNVEYSGTQSRYINRNTKAIVPWVEFSFSTTNNNCKIIEQLSVFGGWHSDSELEVNELLVHKFKKNISKSIEIYFVNHELFDKRCAFRPEMNFGLLAIFFCQYLLQLRGLK